MKAVRWIAAVACLVGAGVAEGAGAGLSRQPPVTARGGPLEPVFRWKAGQRVDVRVWRRTERTRAGKVAAQDGTARTAFTVEVGERGALALVFERAAGPLRTAGAMERFAEAVERFGYGEIAVSAEGALEGLYLTEEADAALTAALESRKEEDRGKAAALERLLVVSAKTPMLELWQCSVGAVPRRRLAPGIPLVIPSESTNPLNGKRLTSSLHYELKGRVRCSEGDAQSSCVLLAYRYVHDAKEASGQGIALATAFTGVTPQASLGELGSEGFVVFEEDTLLPRVAFRARTQSWQGTDPWRTVEEVRIEFGPRP